MNHLMTVVQKAGKIRIIYALLTMALLAVEVLIALFCHDNFIRPYIGDVLVVVVIYTFLRIFIPTGVRMLPLYIFLFATCVEVLQFFQVVKLIGLENNTFFRILIGSVADIKDVICYLAGCVILGVWEWRKESIKSS